MNRNQFTLTNPFVLGLITLLMISCSDTNSANEPDVDTLVNEVRTATQSFQNFDLAQEAGWAVDLSGCVEHPSEGGMGHHFARPEFIDGRVNHLEPQILLYEPTEDGGFELAGVEYIIPFEILPSDAQAPRLFDEHFHQNPELQIWALHVWSEKANPKGMFYDWNPNVSCQYEQPNVDQMLNEVRETTAEYNDVDNAIAAGWDNVLSPCVENPQEGGMGYHYGRMEYVDGRTNHLEPQILLYEPLEDGSLEFVGVEYIIPFAIHPSDAEAPMLFGEQYHQNPELEIWALHVWTEKENSLGVFNDWNPNVSCQFADDE